MQEFVLLETLLWNIMFPGGLKDFHPMNSIQDNLQMVKVILLTLNEGIDHIFKFHI